MSTSRRAFMGTAAGAAGALAMSCGKSGGSAKIDEPVILAQAPDGPELKAGVIGCGGRGTGAAINFLKAGPNLKLVAAGDVFEDRLTSSLGRIKKETGADVPASGRFVGFDAFEKVIASGVDIVILATPPHFRAEQFKAAVAAGKHVFMEKPVAVDPVGIKSVIETAGQAKTKNLCVVTGTQRHHQKQYLETLARIKSGMIGDIVSARCYWDMSQLWFRDRKEEWSDMEFMIRDWVNWTWLSGDHIVEQHVHNIDVVNWFTGKVPTKAVGFGGRHRRVTGDQFDFFSVDFEYDDGMHMQSYCRQIDGCANNVSEFFVGTKGSAYTSASKNSCTIFNLDGTIAWRSEGEESSPYDQEHVDMITAIRTSNPLNEARATAESNMLAIMGRISAYTGKEVTWQEMMDSDMRIGPETYALGPVDMEFPIATPGTDKA